MQVSSKFSSVFLAVVCATSATASPFPASLKHRTLQVREIGPGLVIESFHPESSFETFGVSGVDHPLSTRDEFDLSHCSHATLHADANRYGGENYCRLWTAFASRGLDIYAVNHKNNFDTPAGC
ncbi:hypothetical protein GSI_05235 [Ganoderma sinense ZZ0214-1]|uniref:Extracellular metalloproteinase n=1 Tax=Ganoderma sinense ZZ0214-1 TaxID=1077348 RepID=A0A2G8SFI8_9APHY|nr:hypothetical protein GSI_05235 [Ganoderma sinense ZZ0214-1]